jgi:gliding motility-associated-like protein
LGLILKNKKEITCIGLADGMLNVAATGGVKPYTYAVNGTSVGIDSVFQNLGAGNYTILVTDSNGCQFSAMYSIAIPTKKPFLLIEELKGNICKGDTGGMIDWTGTNGFPPYRYTVNSLFLDTVSKLSSLSSGTYFIELVDSAGCKADTSIEIVNSTTLDVSVQAFAASCAGDGHDGKAIAEITGGVSPYTYLWPGYINNDPVLEPASYGLQKLIVLDGEGCTDTVSFTIGYEPCCDLYMPNAFSPNNDGYNDLFRIIHYGIINLKSFEVYDRWGKQVFFTNDVEGGWNGKFKGIDYEIGTYYYLVKYYCQFTKQLNIKSGDFVLLR